MYCVIFTNVIQLLSLNSCAPTAVIFMADVSTVTQLLDVKHNYVCLPLSQ